MKTHHQLLRGSDLDCLAKTVGAHLIYVAGGDLSPDMYAPLSVIVGTDRGAFSWDVAKRKGNVYVQHQGETVTNVSAIRETITEIRDGETAWIYTTDVASVFELTRCVIAIGKASHHTEMLVVKSGSGPGVSGLSRPFRRVG